MLHIQKFQYINKIWSELCNAKIKCHLSALYAAVGPNVTGFGKTLRMGSARDSRNARF